MGMQPDLKTDAQLWKVHGLESGVLAGIHPQTKLEHAGLAAYLHPASLVLVLLHILHVQ